MQPKKETAVSKPTSRFGTTDTSRKTTRKPASRPASAHRDAPGKPARRFSPQAAFVVGGILIVVAIAMLLMNTCGGFKATMGSIELDYGRVDVADNEVKVVVNQNTSRGYEWLYELEGDAATLKAGETEHVRAGDHGQEGYRDPVAAPRAHQGPARQRRLGDDRGHGWRGRKYREGRGGGHERQELLDSALGDRR